ncbi:MAG: Clp1/GlmU family protein [Acidobacteriota bacterium]
MAPLSSILPSPQWHEVLARLERGVILVIGSSGTGKTSFARHLLNQLRRGNDRTALVDGNIAMPAIGVPGCLGAALTNPWVAPCASVFVGATASVHRRAPVLAGLIQLERRVRQAGARTVIVDLPPLTGAGARELVVQAHRALAANQIVALQRANECESFLAVFDEAARLYRLPASPNARRWSREERIDRQDGRLRAHFFNADRRVFPLRALSARGWLPADGSAAAGTAVGLVDGEGYCLGLGRIEEVHPDRVAIVTPVKASVPCRLQLADFRLTADGAFDRRHAFPTLGEGTPSASVAEL